MTFLMLSCGGLQKSQEPPGPTFTTKAAPAWESLFNRSEGWFGGDGIFAIPNAIDESKQIILFSDTMIGKISKGKLQYGYHMVNNSIAVLDGVLPDSSKIK